MAAKPALSGAYFLLLATSHVTSLGDFYEERGTSRFSIRFPFITLLFIPYFSLDLHCDHVDVLCFSLIVTIVSRAFLCAEGDDRPPTRSASREEDGDNRA